MGVPTLEDVNREHAALNVALIRFGASFVAFAVSLAVPYAVYNNVFSIEELLGDAIPEGADKAFGLGVPAVALTLSGIMYGILERQRHKYTTMADANNASYPFKLGGTL